MIIFICLLALTSTAMAESDLQQVLKVGNDEFTAKMFKEVEKAQRGKSCVLSAFSVLSPLAQLALASVGPSHDEILQVIGMPNDNVTTEVFSVSNKRLRSVKGVVLKQANKVYVRDGYSLNQQFATTSKNIFNSEVQNIDFGKQEAAASEINKWVEDHTNNRIKDLVDPTSLTALTAAVLVNAIFFKGQWKIPFEEVDTKEKNFFVNKDKNVQMPMMHQKDKFKYADIRELDAKVLEMAYEGDETSFVVVLPNQLDGIDSLIEKLHDPATFSKCLKAMELGHVSVTLPKFKIETTTKLKEVLQKMNVTKLFNENEARLDNLIKGESSLYVNDAIQKAFIEVNEEGSEAAAANKFDVYFPTSVGSRPYYRPFNADHPFLFYLMENDNILFNGVFRS